MTIIVSLMLLNEGICKKLKLLHCQYITQNSESIIYISGLPSEEKNPPSSGSAYELEMSTCNTVFCLSVVENVLRNPDIVRSQNLMK